MAMRADNGIPSEELWDEIEANYWASMREVRAAEDAQLDAGHRAERKRLDHQTAALVDSQSSLVAERAELLRRLEAINGELHKLEVQKSNLAHDVTDLERRFKERRHALYEERVLDDTNKREMLREYRRISKLTKASQGANGNEGAMEAPPVRPVSTHQEPSGLRAPSIQPHVFQQAPPVQQPPVVHPPLVVQQAHVARTPYPTQPVHVQYGQYPPPHLPQSVHQPPQLPYQQPQPPYQQAPPVQVTQLSQHRQSVERPSPVPPVSPAEPTLPSQHDISLQQNDRSRDPVLSQSKPTSQPVEKEPVVQVPPISEKPPGKESLSGTPRVSETGVEKLPVPDPQQSPQNPTKGPQEVPDAGSAMDVEKLPVPEPQQRPQSPTQVAEEVPDAGSAMDVDEADVQRSGTGPDKVVHISSEEDPVPDSSEPVASSPNHIAERVSERSPGVSEPTPQAVAVPSLEEAPMETVESRTETAAENLSVEPSLDPRQSPQPAPAAPVPSIEQAESATPPKTTDHQPAVVESHVESPAAVPEQAAPSQEPSNPSAEPVKSASQAATLQLSTASEPLGEKPQIAAPEQVAPAEEESAESGKNDTGKDVKQETRDSLNNNEKNQEIAVTEKPTPAQPEAAGPEDHVMSAAGDADPPAETGEDVDMDDASLSSLSTPPSEPMQYEPQFEARQESVPSESPASTDNQVLLVDADGAVVERLQRINVTSHWVDYVLDLPIKRTATLRRGKRLSKEALESIYAVGNSKVSKWLSCYIQATGEIQDVPCQTCARGSGPFQECVVLPNSDYLPRCGNCEWSRLACNLQTRPRSRVGSSSEATGPTKAPKKKQAENQEPVKSGFTPINDSARASPVGQAADESGSKPARDAQKAPSGFETPASTTPLDGTPAPEADDSEAALPEITKATLTLRDNGVIFTDPPCMRGVPLAKISPEHEYWDKSWEPIEPIVEANLQKWKDKYESHVAAGASQSSKFLANRQINRGNSILKFLEEGEFHPYQLFGKEYVTRFLTGYDTLFRMVQTLEELGKFYIDVAPSQWLRQRLVEICEEQGTAFVLSRTVHGLYHDKKLIALRAKSGFGNIGRPSGYKFDKPGGSAKKSGKGSKRKEVPEAQQPAQPSPQQQQPPPQSGPGSRSSQRRNRASPEPKAAEQTTPAREAKKQRLTSLPAREDLEYEGYTSSDSYSNDHVMPVDWRIYQVKTRDHSSSCDVTQYWHWVDKADGGGSEGDMFEHQVLRDMKNRRVLWGVYKEPINFHLRLSELTSVTYAPGTQKVVIGTRPIRTVKHRGDVMAYFKRERTKRRFLEFMQNKGVKLIRTNLASIESAWRTLESDVLPTSG